MSDQPPPKPEAKGGRTERAGLAAVFAYLQFGLSIAVGVALVPFVLHHVGVRLYGYWLASGEVLAYAAMADLGVMGVVPWLIAEADGRNDRQGIRRLMSTGFCAAIVVAVIYAILVLVLWRIAPAVLKLEPADRAAIAGPLTLIAAVTAIVMPARVFGTVLLGLQDVKFYGILSTDELGDRSGHHRHAAAEGLRSVRARARRRGAVGARRRGRRSRACGSSRPI